MHERLLRAARTIRSPGDAFLMGRMVAWALVLPLLKAAMPLGRLVRLMAVVDKPAARDTNAEHAIADLARIAHRTVGLGHRDNCLERSLLAYRYLAAANADPVLVIGACPDDVVAGHVWLTVDGAPVHDESATISRFTPVVAFDATGALRPLATPSA